MHAAKMTNVEIFSLEEMAYMVEWVRLKFSSRGHRVTLVIYLNNGFSLQLTSHNKWRKIVGALKITQDFLFLHFKFLVNYPPEHISY